MYTNSRLLRCTVETFPGGSVVKNLPSNAGDLGLIPGSGRSPGEGNGYPLQYSWLGNLTDRGALQSMKSQSVETWDLATKQQQHLKQIMSDVNYTPIKNKTFRKF